MSQVTQTYTASGAGTGPSLEELKQFLHLVEHWPDQSNVVFKTTPGDRPQDRSSWSITISGVVTTT